MTNIYVLSSFRPPRQSVLYFALIQPVRGQEYRFDANSLKRVSCNETVSFVVRSILHLYSSPSEIDFSPFSQKLHRISFPSSAFFFWNTRRASFTARFPFDVCRFSGFTLITERCHNTSMVRIPSVRKHRLGCVGNHRRVSVSARSTLLVASYATRTTIWHEKQTRIENR